MQCRDKRRFGRLLVTLTVAFTGVSPTWTRILKGQGRSRDISLGGLYFHTASLPALRPGQILDLVIALPLPFLDPPGLSGLEARGQVVRLDPPAPGACLTGVALKFHTCLRFIPVEPQDS